MDWALLTRMSAGPVAYGGTLAMSGVKKRLMKKHSDTTSAVMPAAGSAAGDILHNSWGNRLYTLATFSNCTTKHIAQTNIEA
jgi:hypothetical protein